MNKEYAIIKNGFCIICGESLLELQKQHETCGYCGIKGLPVLSHDDRGGGCCKHGASDFFPFERSKKIQNIIELEKKKYGVEYRCDSCSSRPTKEEYENQQWFIQCVLDEIKDLEAK